MINALLLIFALSPAHAAPEVLKLSGLHCDACRETIQKTACADKSNFKSCEVRFTNEKTKDAELLIETKPGVKLDTADLVKKIDNLGYKAEPVNSNAAATKESATKK